MKLTYSIVVATKNRLADLRISLPIFAGQTVLPSQIIIVDSSDDHESVAAFISSLASEAIEWSIIRSRPGLPYQRNRGLELCKGDIVFFPDDDSIWLPNTAQVQLDVYREDVQRVISAACAKEIFTNPLNGSSISLASEPDVVGHIPSLKRRRMLIGVDPLTKLGSEFVASTKFRPGRSSGDIKPVEYMTGFRMSFRTEIIKSFGFDEALVGYAPFEDVDASLSAWRLGAVVACLKSNVYHNKFQGKRGDGRTIGVMNVLNRAYVYKKHSGGPGKEMSRYLRRLTIGYFLAVRDSYTYRKWVGASSALRQAVSLLEVQDLEDLARALGEAREICLRKA